MIDQLRVGIVGALRIAGRNRFLVARIEPDIGLGARLKVRHRDPDQRLAEQRVILLDVMLQRRLVVAGDEAQIAAVILGLTETEIPDMQPDQNRRGADRIGDVGAGRTGVDGDLLAQQPFVVPPRRGRRRLQRQNRHEPEQQARQNARALPPIRRLTRATDMIPSHRHQNSPQIRKFTRGFRASE